ncbi:MAG: hypothetical protein JWO91_1341 [Acidobacteriaceae bacterium]|jgi:hypothetical protein|nr:hypothetical protein [Acidobacteriaceae bacterium]
MVDALIKYSRYAPIHHGCPACLVCFEQSKAWIELVRTCTHRRNGKCSADVDHCQVCEIELADHIRDVLLGTVRAESGHSEVSYE